MTDADAPDAIPGPRAGTVELAGPDPTEWLVVPETLVFELEACR